MTTHTKIKTDLRTLDPGTIVELYELDATDIGGEKYYFCAYTNDGASVVFNTQTYLPLNFKFENVSQNSETLPRPIFKISNVSLTLQSEIETYNSLLNSTLTRTRTLKKYLDGEAEANPNITFQPDKYIVHKKISSNKYYIQWELRSPIDAYRTLLPKKQILREVCQFNYRIYVDGAFVYDTADPCPYTGTNYFDEDDNPTTAANDKCRKLLCSCLKRYPLADGSVPFLGCPSIGKTRI